jgi:hypothetical protein
MGLFASEGVNGTQELLMTSRLRSGARARQVSAAFSDGELLVVMSAAWSGIVFLYRPRPLKTLGPARHVASACCTRPSGARLVGDRNQLIAFFLAFAVLIILWLLGVMADLGGTGGAASAGGWVPTCCAGSLRALQDL